MSAKSASIASSHIILQPTEQAREVTMLKLLSLLDNNGVVYTIVDKYKVITTDFDTYEIKVVTCNLDLPAVQGIQCDAVDISGILTYLQEQILQLRIELRKRNAEEKEEGGIIPTIINFNF